MGYRVGILEPTPDSPAGQVADFQIEAAYDDATALMQLARRTDVLTYEFENVDLATLEAAGALATLPQGTELLAITRDRLREKSFLRDHQIPVTPFVSVAMVADLPVALEQIGYPAILKTITGGYDGHGQQDINSPQDLAAAEALVAQAPCILEQRQPFKRELSLMVTRDAAGAVQTFPVVENRHRQHILHVTLAPAPDLNAQLQTQMIQLATTIANAVQLRGVLGIECFETPAGIIVNELAPRPHNSGHYSIEVCNISQFEAHIRSIVGLPIPPIQLQQPAVMRNLLGDELQAAQRAWPRHPEWHLHDYGKGQARTGRKMGHLTMIGEAAVTTARKEE